MDTLSIDGLIRHLADGNTARYLYFWGHKQRGTVVDQSCLSQWFPARFEQSGHSFPTAEHFMMWRKAEIFHDSETAAAILDVDSPGAAKALGRRVRDFDEDTWVEYRWDVVVSGNLAKFSCTPALGKYLLATGRSVLVEASPHDRIWGIGMDKTEAMSVTPDRWQGENILGFALMEVRDRLRKQ
ncbi:MAG: NADAR family protein [Pseudomonadota bacterium]